MRSLFRDKENGRLFLVNIWDEGANGAFVEDKKGWILILSFLFLVSCADTPAHNLSNLNMGNSLTTSALFESCQESIKTPQVFLESGCANYIRGYMDGFGVAGLEVASHIDSKIRNKVFSEPRQAIFCVNFSSTQEIANSFVKWGSAHPDKLATEASSGVLASLKSNFPCNK